MAQHGCFAVPSTRLGFWVSGRCSVCSSLIARLCYIKAHVASHGLDGFWLLVMASNGSGIWPVLPQVPYKIHLMI